MALAKLLISLCFVFIFNQPFAISIIENKIDDEVLHKPPLKTIKTREGDIVDCINIFKQHTIDRPSFNNQTIQVKPTVFSKNEWEKNSTSKKAQNTILGTVDCPRGTIPKRRTSKEYQFQAKSFFNKITTNNIHPSTMITPGRHQAIMRSMPLSGRNIKGIQATIQIYNPLVGPGQSSSSQVWIENGTPDFRNSIQFGWMVNPTLYGDNQTRSFMLWSAKEKYSGRSFTHGCFNDLCKGFVQTDNTFVIGGVLNYIQWGDIIGPFEFTIRISQDHGTGHWWLMIDEKNIGYWPRWVLPIMSNGASQVVWGGETHEDDIGASPGMGGGDFPNFVNHPGCVMHHMKVVDASGNLVDPEYQALPLDIFVDSDCYELTRFDHNYELVGFTFLFGGPGGPNCGI